MHTLYRYIKKLHSLGGARAITTLRHQLQKRVRHYMPNRHHMQPTSWHQLVQLASKAIHQPEKLSFLKDLEKQISINQLHVYANRYVHNIFDVLGSDEQQLHDIPWHYDIGLYAQNPSADCMFNPQTYFTDIVITASNTQVLGKDIKVPWQLARFIYTPVLGLAYALTHNERYAHAAQQQISSWLDANPFGYGIHWFNGMEVGIRAVNWIIALQWLQKPFQKNQKFYERLLCSLYDHMRYLENNWEWYDGRTNNHYLANLVGYAYLCWFFNTIPETQKKWRWCYKQVLQELDWQVFDEGTSYEGSTRYHVLVTELFVHSFLIAINMGESLPKNVATKLTRMAQFIEDCTPIKNQPPIAIGDDDGSSLLHKHIFDVPYFYSHLDIDTKQAAQSKYYNNFGISFFKNRNWHISLRHNTYANRQPTGHFHHDIGSITIAYQGLPLIVDPGTYVYTASSYWRNYFRSASVHNTIYQATYCKNEQLFSLPLKSMHNDDSVMKATIAMPTGRIERTIIVEDTVVRIIDQCIFDQPQILSWNFTFAPQVTLYQEQEIWYGKIDQYTVRYRSTLMWSLHDTWISPQYGCIEKAQCLKGTKRVTQEYIEHLFLIH